MSKVYRVENASDMHRLGNDLKKFILSDMKEKILKDHFSVVCPHCDTEVSVVPGKSACPQCGKTIDLKIDFNF